MEDIGFLVAVEVFLIGGEKVEVTDAFRAEEEEEARNMALNVFIEGRGAVRYGDAFFVMDAVAAVKLGDSDSIDLSLPGNKKWLDSVDVFERLMEQQENEIKRTGPRTAIAESGLHQTDF